jgi:hypothetical protein
VLQVAGLVSLLVLHIFVGLQEGMELVIEVHLGVLHGYEHLQLLFESQKSLVSSALLLHEDIDIVSKGLNITVSPVLNKVKLDFHKSTYLVNRHSDAIHAQLILGLRLSDHGE